MVGKSNEVGFKVRKKLMEGRKMAEWHEMER